MRSVLHDAPAVVEFAEAYDAAVAEVARIKRGADFIDGRPLPGEFDICRVGLLADSGDAVERAAGDGNFNRGLAASSAETNERTVSTPEGVSRMSQQGDGASAGGQETVLAEIQPWCCSVRYSEDEYSLVGYDTGLQEKTLRSAKGVGGGD